MVLKLENLESHGSSCVFNSNQLIICVKGCNIKFTPLEYKTHNCFLRQKMEIINLNKALNKFKNTPIWQLCYNISISMDDPNVLEYGRFNNAELGLVQSFHSLTQNNSYFKCHILDQGLFNMITIGLTRKCFPINDQPGMYIGSIGYRGEDGKLFHASPVAVEQGPRFQKGDIIECGIKFPLGFVSNTSAEVYFLRNGQSVFKSRVFMRTGGFYPTIAMRTLGGKVSVEFKLNEF